MSGAAHSSSAPWAIVIADDHGRESGLTSSSNGLATPVQYCQSTSRRSLFQDALHRAVQVAPASQILVTVLADCRCYWEPSTWFVRPQHRIISTAPGMSWLSTASAILAIAYTRPDSIVTLLPGRCFVSHESILTQAMNRAALLLPLVPEAVISLGMLDLDGGIDEDYLVPNTGEREFLQPLLGVARRPVPWVAQYLRTNGALVAS